MFILLSVNLWQDMTLHSAGCRLDGAKRSRKIPDMNRPIAVRALDGRRIEVMFEDGVSGALDMSQSIGRGVFAPLRDPRIFAAVYLGDHGQIAWSDEMEICPDAAYLEIIGQLTREPVHA
jgi:hypothetical protein